MKKIFLLLVAASALVACDPTHEDIGNAGSISAEELHNKTQITVDKAGSGQNGNVITCQTSAAVNTKWDIGGKEFIGNFATKKMKLGKHKVVLTALCPDGTVLKDSAFIECQEITDPLQKFWIYGDVANFPDQVPFQPGAWAGAAMRFSSTEAQHFPTIPDDVYFGFKTLILDVSSAEGCTMLVNNGWWSATYYDDLPINDGPNEIQITEEIAKTCAKGNGGEGKDLQFIFKSGNPIVNSVYYEE